MALGASQFDMHHWLKYRELNDDGNAFSYRPNLNITAIPGGYYHAGKRRQSRSTGRRAHQYSMLTL